MFIRAIRGCLSGLALAVASSAWALEWSQTEVRQQSAPGQKIAEASFAFRNAGDQPVHIFSVQPSCDCVTAKAPKNVYAPGEAGNIAVSFALDGREGPQEKIVTVTTSDAPKRPTTLKLFVEIGEPVAIAPRLLIWQVGENTVEKAFVITVSRPDETALGNVQAADESFGSRIEKLPTLGSYRVWVKPATTARLAQTTIRLNATVLGQPRVFVLQAMVK